MSLALSHFCHSNMYRLAGKLRNLAPQNWGLPTIPIDLLLVRTLFDFSIFCEQHFLVMMDSLLSFEHASLVKKAVFAKHPQLAQKAAKLPAVCMISFEEATLEKILPLLFGLSLRGFLPRIFVDPELTLEHTLCSVSCGTPSFRSMAVQVQAGCRQRIMIRRRTTQSKNHIEQSHQDSRHKPIRSKKYIHGVEYSGLIPQR